MAGELPRLPADPLRPLRRLATGALAPALDRGRPTGERPAALAHARGGNLDLPVGGLVARGSLRAGLPRRARSGPVGRLARRSGQGEKGGPVSREVKASRRAPRRSRSRTTAASRSGVRLLEGDCLEVLRELEPESVDAIVTDPPYAIGRLAKESWDERGMVKAATRAGHDRLGPSEAFEAWSRTWAKECQRVMKPGAFLAAFGSPRTYH